MTNTKAIRVPGWKTEITADRITFERGDWFCIANFTDVIRRAKQYKADGWNDNGAYAYAAKDMVREWIYKGAPAGPKAFRAMAEAIAEAVKKNS